MKTNKSSTYYGYVFNETTGEMTDESDNELLVATASDGESYINPYVNFTGRLIRDKNEVITGIVFEQQLK